MGVVEQASGTIRVGIDVGGSSIKWVFVDDDQMVERGRRSTPATSRENDSGRPCGCGATGCPETVARARGMVRQAREAIARGGLSSALDILTPVIEAPIRERAAIIGGSRVVVSSLGLYAGAIGAALWKENT